jgi:class 3 adenylate cyclase
MRTFESVIVLADISGYTRFVVMHRSSVIHAEQIVSELIETVTENASFPLTIQKLEGDAAFLTAEVAELSAPAINDVMRQVVAFMAAFRDKQKELFDKSVGGCICTACQSIENLRLKTVMHAGTILEKEVSGMIELAGEPVIVAHRLLKNSIEADNYILVTDAISTLLDFEPYGKSKKYHENVEDVGTIEVKAFFPPERELDRRGVRPLTRVRGNVEAMRLFIARFISKLRRGTRWFRNLPA